MSRPTAPSSSAISARHPAWTVGRPRTRPPRSVDLPLEPLEFTADTVTLYVSRLHPSGARYEPLVRAPLAS